MLEPLGERERVLGGEPEEVLDTPLGIVGERIDASDVLLRAGDPHRRAPVGQRPRAAHRRDDELGLRGHQRRRQQPVGRQAHRELDRVIDGDDAADEVAQRLAPHLEHRVGADERVAQRGRLLDVEALGLRTILGVGEIEIARHPQQLAGRHRRAGGAAAAGHVRLQRPEIGPAVEDHRHRLAQRETVDPQRDRHRRRVVEQRPAQQLLGLAGVSGGILVEHGPLLYRQLRVHHLPTPAGRWQRPSGETGRLIPGHQDHCACR